jgi:phosphonate transport system substrate-binding protein
MNRASLRRAALVALSTLPMVLAACGSDEPDARPGIDSPTTATSTTTPVSFSGTLRISAIPDQDPDKLVRTYGLVSDYLEKNLPGVTVEYVPVTDYQASVSSFRTGDLDLVWFGGLTGVQARKEVAGASAIAQRDIDARFTSVFIANAKAGVTPFTSVQGLSVVRGKSFTFGSESSTSGRVMPQYFLSNAGVDVAKDLTGKAGFSGSHDKTVELVSAGTFDVGALNSQVWDTLSKEGKIDATKVVEVFRTPPYVDYHWVVQPTADGTFGEGFTTALTDSLLAIDGDSDEEKAILEQFGAGSFIAADPTKYGAIEEIAKTLGVIR